MIPSFPTSVSRLKNLLFSISLFSAVALAGCGAGGVFPESTAITTAPAEVQVGAIKGSNYGGHAPLVGAHIYLLQTGSTGYGSVTKGLLNATYSGSFATTKNVNDQFVPSTDSAGNPYYYETADAYGQFNLTGDYTCNVGQPVYIVGYGGSPSFVGAGPNVFSISTEETYNNGSTGVYLTYVVNSPPELFYVGESVTISGSSSGTNGFNQTGTVLGSGFHYDGSAAPLSTTTFSIFVPYNSTLTSGTGNYQPGAYGGGSVIATATPAFNPAAVNMAMLGVCPSSGNFSTGASAIRYVYMNEISTTAMAYAMNGYVPWGTNDQSGNDEFHIGAPNTTQAQQGIQNAAINAGNLYDIQYAAVSSSGDGEGHLARSTTPSGQGAVPQTLIDTIGNTLAACVDSNNTYRNGTGTQSPQCLKLDQYAQDNGYNDTTATTHYAFNIAQAAFNIAKYPQGMGTATTSCGCYGGAQTYTAGTATTAAAFSSALFSLPTGNVPFTPNLSAAPNDFSVAINWQTSSVSGTNANSQITDLAIDAAGNVWVPGSVSNKVYELSPSGTYTVYTPPTGSTVSTSNPGGITIDASGNAWVSATAGTLKFVPGNTTGTVVGTSASAGASQLVIDSAAGPTGPYIYIANNNGSGPGNAGATNQQLTKISSTTGAVQSGFPIAASGATTPNTAGACAWDFAYLTLDAGGNIWTTSQNNVYNPDTEVCRFTSAGVLKYALNVTPNSNVALPHQIAIDAGGNAWFAEKDSPYIAKITAGTTTFNSGVTNSAAGSLSAPKGVAVDGANTIWISNTGNGSIAQFSNANVAMSPTYYSSAGTGQVDYLFTAVDISGNVWALESAGQLVEYIGTGTPTVQPLSLARSTGKLGAKP